MPWTPSPALTLYARAPTTSDIQPLNHIWLQRWATIRAQPMFTGFVRDAGLAAYWDLWGPPDLCRKLDLGDDRCE